MDVYGDGRHRRRRAAAGRQGFAAVTLTRRHLLGFAAAGLGSAWAGCAVAQAVKPQETRFFRIGTGGLGGLYYPIGGMLALAISNPPGSRPCDKGGSCGVPGLVAVAQSSHGSLANVRAIAAGTLDSGFAQADVAYWAYTGSGIFQGQQKLDQLRTIANLYPEHVHLVVRKGASVDTPRDLKGKRVSLDETGSGTLVAARLILESYGLKETDLQAHYMPADQAVQRMKDGALDALFFFAGYPAPAISELADTVAIDLVPINGAPAQALRDKFGFFAADTVPIGIYKGVTRTDTLSVGAQWIVSSNVPDQLVYEITAALWNETTRQLLDKGPAKAKQIQRATALIGLAAPLHPGAERYYREVGALK
jgi:TRAP transporter TAXI family solute receptor